MAAERSRNFKRIGLQVAFWAVLGILLLTILQNFINLSQTTQLSAYDDDWDDMSAFREDINAMGVETKSLVSSPLLLADIEDPRNTTFVIAGVERDTLSFPQFDEDGFITIAITKTVIRPRKLMPLWNLLIMAELSSSSKTLAMLEALVRHMAFDIRVTNSMIPITLLNLIRTTFGCACRRHRVA